MIEITCLAPSLLYLVYVVYKLPKEPQSVSSMEIIAKEKGALLKSLEDKNQELIDECYLLEFSVGLLN